MDIYENIIIGNFLFNLGAEMGKRAVEIDGVPIAVNLLQQTPLDKSVGDVLIQGACVMRLLEFKRSKNDDSKEKTKRLLLERTLSNQSFCDLIPLSRQVHWFIQSNVKSHSAGAIDRIVPYLDFEDMSASSIDLEPFIADMVSDAISLNSDCSEIYTRYLNTIALSQGSTKGGSGGLVVAISATGKVSYAVIEDFRELGYELSMFHQLCLNRQNKLQYTELMSKEHEHQRTYEKKLERGIDGPSR